MFGDVNGDWAKNLSPFTITLGQHSEMCHAPQAHVIDAKSVFDMVKKETFSSKQDKRVAIELAIVIEAMRRADAKIRWVPHFKMFCDSLTKTDLQKSAGALLHLLRTGYVKLVDETAELQVRASDASRKSRSHAASNRGLQLEDFDAFEFCVAQEKVLELYTWLGSPAEWCRNSDVPLQEDSLA